MNQQLQILRCKAGRLGVPQPLLGHSNYVKNLLDVARCLEAYAPTAENPRGNPGALVSISDKRMRNILAAIMQHAASGCPDCIILRKQKDLKLERRLVAALERYERSDHGESKSALTNISIILPVADGSSGEEGGETFLLDSIRIILKSLYTVTPVSAPEAVASATA